MKKMIIHLSLSFLSTILTPYRSASTETETPTPMFDNPKYVERIQIARAKNRSLVEENEQLALELQEERASRAQDVQLIATLLNHEQDMKKEERAREEETTLLLEDLYLQQALLESTVGVTPTSSPVLSIKSDQLPNPPQGNPCHTLNGVVVVNFTPITISFQNALHLNVISERISAERVSAERVSSERVSAERPRVAIPHHSPYQQSLASQWEAGKIGPKAWAALDGSNPSLATALTQAIGGWPGSVVELSMQERRNFTLRINQREQDRIYKF